MPESTSSTSFTSRRGLLFGTAAASAGALLVGCTSNDTKQREDGREQSTSRRRQARQAHHHRLRGSAGRPRLAQRDQRQRQEPGQKYSDVTLEITEGSNDTAAQIGQIETLINKKVDVLVVLPADGKALTQVGLKAMRAGIPVVNLDRIFNTPQAYRCWIGGDTLRHGPQRRPLHRREAEGQAGRQGHQTRRARQPGTHPAAHPGLRRGPEELPPTSRRWPARPPTSLSSPDRPRWPNCFRPSRSSTRCGTTTTTRAWARCAPSSRPAREDFLMVLAVRARSPPSRPSRPTTAS